MYRHAMSESQLRSRVSRRVALYPLGAGIILLVLHGIGLKFRRTEAMVIPFAVGMLFLGVYGLGFGLRTTGHAIKFELRSILALALGVAVGYLTSR